jgi:protein-ribulosamine 3-kinase
MNKDSFRIQIEEIINQKVKKIISISNDSVAGKFLAQTDENQYFIKASHDSNLSYQCEATGLKNLSQVYPHVPKIISFSNTELIISFIDTEAMTESFWQELATLLSKMHKQKKEFFGFFENNFIGLSNQENLSQDNCRKNWSHFFWQHRLLYKINQLKEARGFALDQETQTQLKKAVIQQLEAMDSQPTLIHGDLWSGNILCGLGQKPFLIDPAVSFSDREADIAMTECFGGFPPLFYETYNNDYPLQAGYQNRKHIYNLYHLLNHFVIFGESYKSSCLEIITLILKN